MISLLLTAALSLQLEAGALDIRNPSDDQYVIYHANGLSYGVQMTSPVAGIALREDLGRFVLTAGARNMGHQYIDTDVIPDDAYFKCRFKGTCPASIERWYLRMTTYQGYVSAGYKIRWHGFDIVPTIGYGEYKLRTSVEMTFPYTYRHNAGPFWWEGDHQDQPHPFSGLDIERGRMGIGVYLLSISRQPSNLGDPGQGVTGVYIHTTVRFGP
jgi:hypothetical protein